MTNTTKRIFFIALIAGVLAAVAFIAIRPCTKGTEADGREEKFATYSLYAVETGWGYDIFVDGNLYIHQPFVPVISGERGFPDSLSAETAVRLVLGKLKKGETPSLTEEEVKRILSQ